MRLRFRGILIEFTIFRNYLLRLRSRGTLFWIYNIAEFSAEFTISRNPHLEVGSPAVVVRLRLVGLAVGVLGGAEGGPAALVRPHRLLGRHALPGWLAGVAGVGRRVGGGVLLGRGANHGAGGRRRPDHRARGGVLGVAEPAGRDKKI